MVFEELYEKLKRAMSAYIISVDGLNVKINCDDGNLIKNEKGFFEFRPNSLIKVKKYLKMIDNYAWKAEKLYNELASYNYDGLKTKEFEMLRNLFNDRSVVLGELKEKIMHHETPKNFKWVARFLV